MSSADNGADKESRAAQTEGAAPVFDQGLPSPEALEPFPDYAFYQACERPVYSSLTRAVGIALDFTRQCMDCHYRVDSVVGQEIFSRDQDPYRFIVWQDVSKQILPKLHVKSSSFAEVRLFGSTDRQHYMIDTKSLDKVKARQASDHHQRHSAPAFAVLHSRWTFTALPSKERVTIKLEAGGRTSGIANFIPKPILRYELKNVIQESLRFYDRA